MRIDAPTRALAARKLASRAAIRRYELMGGLLEATIFGAATSASEEMRKFDSMSILVKVFGCLQAYENRPSTNPRGCVNDLWGFGLLAVRGDGGIGSAMAPTGTRRVRLCV
jgi:hypothetical protein